MPYYRIVEHTYMDAIDHPYTYGDRFYTIEEKVVSPFSILNRLVRKSDTWYEWQPISNPESYGGDFLKFKSYDQARLILKKIMNGEVVKGWKEEVIKEFQYEE